MADIQKLDEAFLRFEAALRRVEQAMGNRSDGRTRIVELESEAESLKGSRRPWPGLCFQAGSRVPLMKQIIAPAPGDQFVAAVLKS